MGSDFLNKFPIYSVTLWRSALFPIPASKQSIWSWWKKQIYFVSSSVNFYIVCYKWYVLIWLGYSTQLFNQTLIYMFECYLVDVVVNICN